MSGESRVHSVVIRGLEILTLLAIACVALLAGMEARAWTWKSTSDIRFIYDVNNAREIGQRTIQTANAIRDRSTPGKPPALKAFQPPTWSEVWPAYLSRYDRELQRNAGRPEVRDSNYGIDYPPGRLLAVTAWMKQVVTEHRRLVAYSDDIVGPMLRLNLVHEAFAALGVFFLTRRVLRDGGRSMLRSEMLALFAALLIWFNPALILNAHGWPQWDVWVLPYFFWAVYFGVIERWMLAGVVVALGAMFKGQVLLACPILIVWPLVRGNVAAVLRLLAGFLVTVALLMSPWLISLDRRTEVIWASVAVLVTGLHIFWPRRLWFGTGWWILTAVVVVWLVVPLVDPSVKNAIPAWLLIAFVCAVVLLPGEWRSGRLASWCLVCASVVFLAGHWFDGSFAWLTVGFQTDRYPNMTLGSVVNIPAILYTRFGLNVDTPTTTLLGLISEPLRLQILLRWIAYAGVACAGVAVALASRRRDPNLLIGLVAAWTILYAVLPQMHERYLVWAAGCSALLAARSFAGLFVYAALTAIQTAMLLVSMIQVSGKTQSAKWGPWFGPLEALRPDTGYAVATIAVTLLVWSFVRSRRLPARVSAWQRVAPANESAAAFEEPLVTPAHTPERSAPVAVIGTASTAPAGA